MTRINTLLVEDDPDYVDWVTGILAISSNYDFRVSVADTMQKAELWIMDNPAPDLIILDLYLPDSQCLETVKWMARIAPQANVVVMTSLPAYEIEVAVLKLGVSDFLIKWRHDDMNMLAERLAMAVERKHAGHRHVMVGMECHT